MVKIYLQYILKAALHNLSLIMIKIPNLRHNDSHFSSIQSLDISILQNDQNMDSTIDCRPKSNKKPLQNSIDFSKVAQQTKSPSTNRNNNGKECSQQERQKYSQNYQRFNIKETNLDPSFQASKQQQQRDGKQDCNIFFTQLLDSGVFSLNILKNTSSNTQNTYEESSTYQKHVLSPSRNNQTQVQVQTIPPQVLFQSNVHVLFGNIWDKQNIIINEKEISFIDFNIAYDTLSKIKIFKELCQPNFLRVKLTFPELDLIMGIDLQTQKENNGQFLIFANIIKAKLIHKGIKPFYSYENYQGKLLKKSQHLGRWEKRSISILNSELHSFKDRKEKSTFQINRGSVKELWTRFDLINEMLIIKVSHCLKKTQFGIPISDFSLRESSNWLYLFYELLRSY